MISFGDFVNGLNDDACCQCGRKVGNNAWLVHLSNSGGVLHPASEADSSQGFWPVGRECAKGFDPAVLVKNFLVKN
jgi:hypothetical protein